MKDICTKKNVTNVLLRLLMLLSIMFISFEHSVHIFADNLNDSLSQEEFGVVNENILNESGLSTVVQGADGLLYVVLDEAKPSVLLTPAKGELELHSDFDEGFTSIEVGIDKERQNNADSMNTDVSDMSEIDFTNVEDLQSALNSEDFPFLEQETFVEQIDKTKNTIEAEALVKKTRSYFAEQILVQTNNLNDVPTDSKIDRVAVLASVSGTVKENRINPPSGYGWTVYVTRSNGYDYTENYSVRRTINGKEAFCLQVGVSATTTYTGSTSGYLTDAQKNVLSSIVLAHKQLGGWANTAEGKERWLAAQILVWENSNEKPKSVTVTPNWSASVASHKKAIADRATIIRTIPKYDKTSTTVHEGEIATFNISNGSSYLSATADGGGTVTISNNQIKVDTSKATGSKITVTVNKGVSAIDAVKDPSMVWSNGSYQKLFSGYYSAKQTLTVNVTRKGTVEVLKVDKDTNKALAGATFTFTVGGTNTDVVTGSDGKAKLTTRLKAGTVVSVKEKSAPANYKLDTTSFNITVVADKATSMTRTNEAIKGAVELTKTANVDNLVLQGVVFTLYNSNGTIYQDNLTTNASGKIIVKNMGLGSYYFKEKSTVKGFALDTTNKSFTITPATTETNPAKINMTNTYNLSSSKTVTDMNEVDKTNNIWSADTADYLEYNVTTSIIEKLGTRNVGSFAITDNIDLSKVDFISAKVYSGSADVSSQFSISHTNGVVKATANAGSLTNTTFYGKAYRLNIKMNLKSTIKTSKNKSTFTITKSGSVTVGSSSVPSNTVSTTLNAYKITVKHIEKDTKKLLATNIESKFTGEKYYYAPRTDLRNPDIFNNFYQSLDKPFDGLVSKDLTIEFIYFIPKRKLTVNHIDQETKKILKTVIESKYDNDTYIFLPLTNLLNSEGKLYQTDHLGHKGTVSGKDLTFEISYVIPELTVNVNKVEIITMPAGVDKKQIVELTLDRQVKHEIFLNGFTYRLSIEDSNAGKKLFEKELNATDSIAQLSKVIIPLDDYHKDQKIPLKIKITEGKNPKKVIFFTETKDFNTYSYTSNEKVISNSDIKSGKILIEGIVKTEATRSPISYNEMKENIALDFQSQVQSKTGYGVNISLNPVYFSNLKDDFNPKMTLKMENELVDSYVNESFSSTGGLTSIDLERTKNELITHSAFKSTNSKFEYPEMYVESKTGNLFSKEQSMNRDSRIQHELKIGGRKLYVPIWQDLGSYALQFESNTFGKNLMKFNLIKTLTVDAYMYATMDSDTKDIDELLITPIYPDSDTPKNWSNDDIEWLRNATYGK